MQTVIIVIHLMVVASMIGVVLLQKSEGGGLGVGGGGGFMSTRGTANVLTRATAILAGTFFATSLLLSILAGLNRHPTTIIQTPGGAPAGQTGGQPPAPAPVQGGGLLDQVRPPAPAPQPGGGSPQPPAGGTPPP
jgi:preprotein translocase subunit SecG